MASINQPFLFRWNDVDAQSDLNRLRLVLESLPDEEFMSTLEQERGRGRNDYPIRPLWNSLLARIVFGHDSIESLRRELLRNAVVSILPLLDRMRDEAPDLAQRGRDLALDRGYDSAELNRRLYDDYGLHPIIARRELWPKEGKTRLIDPKRASNVDYDESGNLFCTCPQTHVIRKMVFRGFEKDRQCLKFQCPAVFHGERCKGRWRCCGERKKSGRIVRVPLSVDRRAFTPTDRDTWRWEKLYRGRSSVERVNGRVDRSLGLERHFIRGLNKMRVHLSLALVVMLSMASAWIERGQTKARGQFLRLPKAA